MKNTRVEGVFVCTEIRSRNDVARMPNEVAHCYIMYLTMKSWQRQLVGRGKAWLYEGGACTLHTGIRGSLQVIS